jgi:hypothetical protein
LSLNKVDVCGILLRSQEHFEFRSAGVLPADIKFLESKICIFLIEHTRRIIEERGRRKMLVERTEGVDEIREKAASRRARDNLGARVPLGACLPSAGDCTYLQLLLPTLPWSEQFQFNEMCSLH